MTQPATNLRSRTLDELTAWAESRGFPSYRGSQIAGWLFNRPLTAVEDMHTLPLELREALSSDFDCSYPEIAKRSDSVDGTSKLLIGLSDGKVVESVIIPREQRTTLCISSQVGCALDCQFCATATLGLQRNLDPSEIVGQVLRAREAAAPELLTNYVFMGMGEPLANYDRLIRALTILTARWGLGISPRRITVSTVGLVPQMERLVHETSVHIAVSLTAARDELRDRLMPINRRYPLAELIGACKRLELPRRKRVTFEYVMLDGVNDTLRDADDLVRLLHGVRAKVNLIPFNPFPGVEYARSSDEQINRFQERLLAAGFHATVRISRGRDIQAACGQLAADEKEESAAVEGVR
ncbi:MAG: 23S rRNA (adenine(2503)-C(2))-methyltransferase RlmN [Myxococcales bacterium]|nr:MAG: 23S rRNA (adenine(2503)-C(2))-methyltransferase RlmN [Myxococcales bacterium]